MENIDELTLEELKKGYEILTGLDNADEFTAEQLRQYLKNAMND